MSKERQLLFIEWLDAGVITQGDWLTGDEIMNEAHAERFLNQTCGWLLKEDDIAITLSAQIALDGEKPMYDLVSWIPKVLIRKRKVLKS